MKKATVTKNFDAIVYGWRNLSNEKIYVGFHKTSELHDGYVFSSDSDELNEAWSYGLLQRHIIFRGSVSECITLENYALKYAKANLEWSNFYNQSVGGGEGCVKDFSNLSDHAKTLAEAFLYGVNPPEDKLDCYTTFDYELVSGIARNVKDGKYAKVSNAVNEIFELERNQVRLNIIHEDKVDQIADLMRSNPANARQNIEPVVVCVYSDGTRKVIDGNHTINAAKRAGWSQVDVVFINFSDFEFNHSNVNAFGYEMNHSDQIKTPNSSEDCQRAIINIYHDLLERGEKVDIRSAKFKDTVIQALQQWWTPKKIVSNLERAKVRIATDEAHAKLNFKRWTKPELDKVARGYEKADQDRAVISISSGSCYNSGVGAILNKMAGANTKRGIIVISHNDIGQYDSWKSSEKKLVDVIASLKGSGLSIDYAVLDAFVS